MGLGQKNIGVGAHMLPQLFLGRRDQSLHLVGTYFIHCVSKFALLVLFWICPTYFIVCQVSFLLISLGDLIAGMVVFMWPFPSSSSSRICTKFNSSS